MNDGQMMKQHLMAKQKILTLTEDFHDDGTDGVIEHISVNSFTLHIFLWNTKEVVYVIRYSIF